MSLPPPDNWFSTLEDDDLLAWVTRDLSDEELAQARQELDKRGLPDPSANASVPAPYQGEMVILARDLTPTDAHLLTNCLHMAGIQAESADTTIVQMHSLLALALGGAKIRVPASQLHEAQQVLAAFRRGAFALDKDFDVGEAQE